MRGGRKAEKEGKSSDPKASSLPSQGKDSTVFFLSIEDGYSPIGFVNTPSAVQTLEWCSEEREGQHLLVCCVDGSMLEVEAPVSGQHDTTKTYHLDPLDFTIRKFVSIKDRLRVRTISTYK